MISAGEVPCVIRPWTAGGRLARSPQENDLRGELTFLDKALAVADARRFLAEGTEGPHPGRARRGSAAPWIWSQPGVDFTDGLRRRGDSCRCCRRRSRGGIGRPQVAKIRALDRAARAIWLDRSVDTEAEYDQVFEALCRRYDTPDWDIASLRRALEAEIAERADISIHAISLEIDARMSGRQVEPSTRRMTIDDGECDAETGERGQDSRDSSKGRPDGSGDRKCATAHRGQRHRTGALDQRE